MTDEGVKKAAELFDEKTGKKVLVVLWEDGHVSVCSDGPEHDCYTAEKGGEKLYYVAQAYYAGLGMKVKALHGEC
jgi:hypothetical protein